MMGFFSLSHQAGGCTLDPSIYPKLLYCKLLCNLPNHIEVVPYFIKWPSNNVLLIQKGPLILHVLIDTLLKSKLAYKSAN